MLNGCQPQLDPQNPIALANITPGGGAIVQGSGFDRGVGPKNALILTLTTYFNVPLTVKLENLTWVDNAVGGSIPGDIRGVPDGPATLQLVTAAGARSDLINVNFVAARDGQLLDRTRRMDIARRMALTITAKGRVHPEAPETLRYADNCTSAAYYRPSVRWPEAMMQA